MATIHLPTSDQLIGSLDVALRTLFSRPRAARPSPSAQLDSANVASAPELIELERHHAAGLMRVNHVGEVCAQALYSAQALTAATPAQRAMFDHAAREELDHLAWTAARLGELDARPSLLNPLWYAGSFALGCAAGLMGNRISLGFVVETEKQVEAHLASHLQSHSKGLPAHDWSSRAIAAQMQLDEAAHGLAAKAAGAAEMPRLVKVAMATAAKVMTTTAYRI